MALYEAVFSGLIYGQVWNWKLHFDAREGGPNDAQEVANTLHQFWWGNTRLMMTSSVSLATIAVSKRDGPSLEQFTKPIQETGAHSPETQSMSFMAGVIQKKTGLGGRKHRGRFYVPGIRMGATQFGIISQLELQNWGDVTDALKAAFIDPLTTGLQLVVKNEEGFTVVTDLVMRPILGVMRTRNIGVGA